MHILCAHELFSQERPNVKIAGTAVLLAGVDVTGDCVTEINVSSPTCFQEIFDQTGFDVTAMFVDALEADLAAA